MKKLLFATTNEAKKKRFASKLLECDIELLNLKDLNLKLDVIENGESVIENALIKAREAYKISKMPTISMDDSLYLEGVPDDLQPGLYVRRVNGKTLNDEEMIEHYKKIVNIYGKDGKLNSKYIYGFVLINEEGKEFTYTWNSDDLYLVNVVSNNYNPGYPLDSISKYQKNDKYIGDITEKEKEILKIKDRDVVKFIVSHL